MPEVIRCFVVSSIMLLLIQAVTAGEETTMTCKGKTQECCLDRERLFFILYRVKKWKQCMKRSCQYLEFDVEAGEILNTREIVLGSSIVTNGGEGIAVDTFTFSKAVTEESSFTRTHGITIETGADFETGLPGIVGGKITASASQMHSFQFGRSKSETKTVTVEQQYRAAPGEMVRIKGTVQISEMSIPYKACTFVSSRLTHGDCECSYGVWKKEATWNRKMVVEPY
jgi:hypothetical protein